MTLPDVPRSAYDRQRLFPWRRTHIDIDVAALVEVFQKNHPHSSPERIIKAFEVARDAHSNQVRRSGEPYITHPLLVAHIVAQLGLDDVTISAALLHDSVEDTSTTLDEILKIFGDDIASIVDGVTKLDRIHFQSAEAAQAATMRKMLVAMAKDIRVLIIKLADRLHNMRTIAAMPMAKQKRIAKETIDIYAPLAHRLGIADIKSQLEELCFAVLHPKRYSSIEYMVELKAGERQEFIDEVVEDLTKLLEDVDIKADISGRPKHLWSIYEKMVVKGKDFNEVQDLVGIRVIVNSLKDCYGALGSIHSYWTPVQGRFKDYIAMPKFNLYQSLHTTVIGPNGKSVEVQIRTKDMHIRAEMGIAAHWAYKEENKSSNAKKKKEENKKASLKSVVPEDISSMPWLENIVDWQTDTADPEDFMDMLREDLEYDELFVFTPKGRVITLPLDSTPIDFAYSVHTEVGHKCVGAKVNGRLVPLNAKLDSGDTVEVFTSKSEDAAPSRDWIEFVESSKAKSKIRQWFSRERREDAIDNGKEDVVKELRRLGLPVQKVQSSQTLTSVATEMNYSSLDDLYRAVGEHHVSAKSVGQRIQQFLKFETGEIQLPVSTSRPPRQARDDQSKSIGIHVEGLDDVMVRLSRCCTPVPGDEIIGFITRGRGVSVHRADCANAVALATSQGERLIDVEWDQVSGTSFIVSVELEAFDRPRLLQDIASMLADEHVNILGCNTLTTTDRIAKLRFDFDLGDPSHLDSIIAQIRRIDSVIDAYRILHGGDIRGENALSMAPSDIYRAPIGTKDVLGNEARTWEILVNRFAEIARLNNFDQIITPMFENYEVFMRMGEDSDVVTKEMYDFEDKGGRHITLRPEGTAGVVRAFSQNRPLVPFKAWYCSSVFRYERPQKGRLREHHQLGIEVIGVDDPLVDVEVIKFGYDFLTSYGLKDFQLVINSLGDSEARANHEKELRKYLEPFKSRFDEEFTMRVDKNPFRVLDTKVPQWREVVDNAPSILDFISDGSRADFEFLQKSLTDLGIEFTVKPSLVRGLDYYTNTAFEFISTSLDSAQSTLCAGGRYNKLVEELGGPSEPGIGFGLGIERLLLAIESENIDLQIDALDVYLIDLVNSDKSKMQLIKIANELRKNKVTVDTCYGEKSAKSAFKNADRIGAKRTLILGESELERGLVTLKDMSSGEQSEIAIENIASSLK